MSCSLCDKKLVSEPRVLRACAFDFRGVFKRDNYNCESMRLLANAIRAQYWRPWKEFQTLWVPQGGGFFIAALWDREGNVVQQALTLRYEGQQYPLRLDEIEFITSPENPPQRRPGIEIKKILDLGC
jgi:hypothetical protein